MNLQYDSYGIAVFKGHKGKIQRTPAGVSIEDIDSNRVRMFLLAVLWRMSKSVHEAYLNTYLPPRLQAELSSSFLTNRTYSASRLHVSVRRLHDATPTGAISAELFRDFVVSPFLRKHENSYSVLFVIFGFLVQIHVPGLQLRHRKLPDVLRSNSTTLFAPFIEFTTVSELFGLAVTLRRKEINGISHISDI
jgi:hypothetical protein